MYILKHRRVSMINKARGGVSRDTPSCFIFHEDKLGGALIDILYAKVLLVP